MVAQVFGAVKRGIGATTQPSDLTGNLPKDSGPTPVGPTVDPMQRDSGGLQTWPEFIAVDQDAALTGRAQFAGDHLDRHADGE